MRESDRRVLAKEAAARRGGPPLSRTTQIIFGERQHLLDVHAMLRQTQMDNARRRRELKLVKALIEARNRELDRINPDWGRKVKLAMNPRTRADQLARLAMKTPRSDYLLLRTISEHPSTPAFILAELAKHPYDAIRENVARHPNTDAATLEELCRTHGQPLWYLVAFNPNTPPELREKLRAKIKRMGAPRPGRLVIS